MLHGSQAPQARMKTPPPAILCPSFPLTPPSTVQGERVERISRAATPPSPSCRQRSQQDGQDLVHLGEEEARLIKLAEKPRHPYFSPISYEIELSPNRPPTPVEQQNTASMDLTGDTPQMERFMAIINDMEGTGGRLGDYENMLPGPRPLRYAWWVTQIDQTASEESNMDTKNEVEEQHMCQGTPLFLEDDSDTEFDPDRMDIENVESEGDIEWVRTERVQSLIRLEPNSVDQSLQIHYDEALDLGAPTFESRRSLPEDDDIECIGMIRAAKRGRLSDHELPEHTSSGEEDVPLRELGTICEACGCRCGMEARGARGSGSTILTRAVRANILECLLGKESLYRRMGGAIHDWADIAELVGARREDFDRVRHCAAAMQRDLPGRMRRGEM